MSLILKRSSSVELEYSDDNGAPLKLTFKRPSCATQLEWMRRLSEIRELLERAGDAVVFAPYNQEHIQSFLDDLSEYLIKCDGELVKYSAEDLGSVFSPEDAYILWSMFLTTCKPNLGDRGKSRMQSESPQMKMDSMTAEDAEMRPRSSDHATTNSVKPEQTIQHQNQ